MKTEMRPIRFGTDGWRALIAETFTFDNVRHIGQAMADYLHERREDENGVAIGYDTRFLSDRFARTLAEVLAANRIPVFLSASFCPTPLVSFAVRRRGLAAGVMVTASHNPYTYNGVKFKGAFGGPALVDTTRAIEKHLFQNQPRMDTNLRLIEECDFFPAYQQHLRDYFDWSKIESLQKKVVFDAMHGAGCGYLDKLLPEAWRGGRLHTINQDPHPLFKNKLPEPILKNLSELQQTVVAGGFDAGLACDGDADRFGVLDNQGRFVELHDLMPLLFRHLLQTRGWPGDVVRTTSMANTVDKMAGALGRRVIEVPVGFKNVAEQMLEREILIGGEESGGFGYRGHLPERDGLFSCLLVLELLAESGQSLADHVQGLRRDYGPFAYDRIDQHCAVTVLQQNMQALRAEPPGRIGPFKVESVTTVDGIKFYFSDGSWMLMRVSDTEPLGRIYVGSTSPGQVRQLLDAGRAVLFG